MGDGSTVGVRRDDAHKKNCWSSVPRDRDIQISFPSLNKYQCSCTKVKYLLARIICELYENNFEMQHIRFSSYVLCFFRGISGFPTWIVIIVDRMMKLNSQS